MSSASVEVEFIRDHLKFKTEEELGVYLKQHLASFYPTDRDKIYIEVIRDMLNDLSGQDDPIDDWTDNLQNLPTPSNDDNGGQ